LTLPASALHRGNRDADALKELPAFYRVTATLKPTKDSDIRIEVWLRASGWNGGFLGVGNRGWAGRIHYEDLTVALRGGFATAGTDTWHQGNGPDASFRGYRSIREMTVRAKR